MSEGEYLVRCPPLRMEDISNKPPRSIDVIEITSITQLATEESDSIAKSCTVVGLPRKSCQMAGSSGTELYHASHQQNWWCSKGGMRSLKTFWLLKSLLVQINVACGLLHPFPCYIFIHLLITTWSVFHIQDDPLSGCLIKSLIVILC